MQEALETLPALADEFEIIAVDDGSKDRTREIADRLAAEHPGVVRAIHHDVNRGYGGALRSGFEASRFELLALHGRGPPVPGRGHRPPDRAPAGPGSPRRRRRLPHQARRPVHPDRVRTHLQAREPRLLRPEGPRRRLRLQAVPARGTRGRSRRVRRRILLRGAADQGRGERPVHRGGRRPSLPADRRVPDGSEAVGDLACRQGLLAVAAPAVGERRPGAQRGRPILGE